MIVRNLRTLMRKITGGDGNIGTLNGHYRDIWLEKTLKKIPSNKKILDAGAGEGFYKKFCEHLNYTSQDFCQYDGKGNSEGEQNITGTWDTTKIDIISDITNIPVEDNSFDIIMCISVFEHIPDPIKATAEFSRIIKPGGTLIISAPFCSITHFAPYYFSNGFSKYWYEKILPENGFKITEIDYNGNYFAYLAQEIRRIPQMEEKYTKNKRAKLSGNIISSMIFKIMLLMLNKLSKINENSEEMLCFGLHIVATKK